MKNCPPCCGLWLPCARGENFLRIAEPSGHVPGDADSLSLPAHVHDTAAVTCTSGVPSIGQRPGFDSITASGLVAQVQTESSRVGTSVIPHLRHLPGWSSITSSSPGITHTYDSGGSFSFC